MGMVALFFGLSGTGKTTLLLRIKGKKKKEKNEKKGKKRKKKRKKEKKKEKKKKRKRRKQIRKKRKERKKKLITSTGAKTCSRALVGKICE